MLQSDRSPTQFSEHARNSECILSNEGRLCNSCRLPKPWSDFGKKVGGQNGYNSVCKNCRAKNIAKGRHMKRISRMGNSKKSHVVEISHFVVKETECICLEAISSLEPILREAALDAILDGEK